MKDLNPAVKESLTAQEQLISKMHTIWIYEDALPEGYPYDEMFEKSQVIDGVRMFPDLTKVYVTYTPPIDRTKDLTDEELDALWHGNTAGGWRGLFRAVISKDRELNRG